MAIAHRHFDAGTRAVLDHGVALAAGRQRLDPLTWSIANTSDLLKRALGDSAEIWDVWMQLRESASGSAISCEGAVPVNLATATAAGGWERLVEVLGDEDMAAANVAASTNEHAAESLRAVAESGRLEVGTRAWLSAVTVFEWNRWGLPTNLEALREALSWVSDHCRPDLPCQQLHSSATRASATGRQSMQRDDIDRAES